MLVLYQNKITHIFAMTFFHQVTKHLFAEEPPHGLGTDLISLNIQRAREHGLPGKRARTARYENTDCQVREHGLPGKRTRTTR